MKIFYPERNLQFPLSHSGLSTDLYVIQRGRAYIAADNVVDQMLERESRQMRVEEIENSWEGQYQEGETLTVLCPGGLGDMLALRVVLHLLREQYPGLMVHVASTPDDHEILHPYVDKISPYPLALDVAQPFEYLASIENILRQSEKHELFDTFAAILRVEVPKDLTPYFDIEVHPLDAAVAANWVQPRGDRPRVGLQTKSATHYRSYPAHRNALVALELTRTHNFEVYFIGSMDQRISFRKGGESCAPPEHCYDLCGLPHRFREVCALIDQMDVIIGPDSAMLHVGAMLGKPTLGLFSITNAQHRTGYYPTVMYIQGEAECAPCLDIARHPSCGERYCKAMLNIHPYYVADVAKEMYEHGGRVEDEIPFDADKYIREPIAAS